MDLQGILTIGLLVSLFANLQLFQDLRSLHDKSQRALQLVIDNCEDQLQEDNIVEAESTVSRLTKSVKKSLKQAKKVISKSEERRLALQKPKKKSK